ncbi:hypothetical protein [Bradyrhizobium sp. Ec3.3]|uniref:hypothetical protein n=1 Tax=Bradyrhizobium sp. Ec3.3 TaxID=189753 RepID=UPI0012EB063F|nr:hypothetical protein [Bradyrhizobium sp. Ec3.3]
MKLVKGRLLVEHSDRSLGEPTSCNAFIFSRLAESIESVNPLSLHAHAGARTGSALARLVLQRLTPIVSRRAAMRASRVAKPEETAHESSQSPL